MKLVWKCEFCSSVDTDIEVMKIHESKCVFSKDRKSCYTCKFSYESGLGGEHIPGCELKMDIYEGYKGDCAGWVWEKLEEDRDNKLKDLGL